MTVELALAEGRVTALAHTSQACVLTQASAALLADQAAGKDRLELATLAASVRAFLNGGPPPAGYGVFDGVAAHAGRHVCVMLPFEAALKALEGPEPGAERTQHKPGS